MEHVERIHTEAGTSYVIQYPQIVEHLKEDWKELFNYTSKDRVLFVYDVEEPKDKSELRAIMRYVILRPR